MNLKTVTMRFAFVLLLVYAPVAYADELSPQHFARLGDWPLQSGQVLKEAALGYRTWGTLSAAGDNVILAPTWFTGKSGDWKGYIGPDKSLDIPGIYVIVIDSLANGVSSSPSQMGRRANDYPQITIGDMVNAAHTLVTEHLGITHARAVVGVSMAGMQALQWATDHPDFMDNVVSIVGTPRVLDTDIQPWRREVEGKRLHARIHNSDRRAQLRAMLTHDIAPDKPWSALVGHFPRALFLVDDNDSLLSPAPSLELSVTLGATSVRTASKCGHLGPMVCNTKHTRTILRAFLGL